MNSYLKQRFEELKIQYKKKCIRTDFYIEMVNIAEAKFNIPIRKKAECYLFFHEIIRLKIFDFDSQ